MRRHNITTATILLTGCIGAAIIFVTAESPSENPFAEFEHSNLIASGIKNHRDEVPLNVINKTDC